MKIAGFSLLFLALLSACSGGGGRDLGGGGRYCSLSSLQDFGNLPRGAKELSRFDLENDEKNTANPEDVLSEAHLPVGTYTLQSAEFLYVRKEDPKNQRRWVMTQIRDETDTLATEMRKLKNGGVSEPIFKTSRYCAAGYRVEDASYEASMEGLTKLQVSAGNKIDFEVTTWGYIYDGEEKLLKPPYLGLDPVTAKAKPSWKQLEDPTKYSAPKEVFGDQLTILSLRKLSNKDKNLYQLYSKLDAGDGKTYYLLRVVLQHTP